MRHMIAFRLLLAALTFATSSVAQELEPRSYSNTPTGINLLALGLAQSQGNVLMDPALPIEGLEGHLNMAFVRYTRTFGLLGKSSKLKLMLPYSTGDWVGTFEDQPASRNASGFGDLRLDLNWNFMGAPAANSKEIANYQQRTIVGTGIRLIAPTGKYHNDRALNLGSNRWSARTELGISRALGRWALELIGGVWWFGDNNDFFNGMRLEQKPLYILKTHAIYSFRPGFWIGSSLGFGNGGRTSINGVARNTSQQNWRLGFTIAYPIDKNNGLNLTLSSGANNGTGADFDTLTLAYQYAWGDI